MPSSDEQWLIGQGFSFYVSTDPDRGRVYYVAYYKGEVVNIVDADSLGHMEELYRECKEFLNGLSRVE